jgi:hypothetical protein
VRARVVSWVSALLAGMGMVNSPRPSLPIAEGMKMSVVRTRTFVIRMARLRRSFMGVGKGEAQNKSSIAADHSEMGLIQGRERSMERKDLARILKRLARTLVTLANFLVPRFP